MWVIGNIRKSKKDAKKVLTNGRWFGILSKLSDGNDRMRPLKKLLKKVEKKWLTNEERSVRIKMFRRERMCTL